MKLPIKQENLILVEVNLSKNSSSELLTKLDAVYIARWFQSYRHNTATHHFLITNLLSNLPHK
jgi:hypothetical protein